MLLAGLAGCLSYAFFPGTGAAPVADQLSARAMAGQTPDSVLGSGRISTYDPAPASLVTATASGPGIRHRRPGPVHTVPPTAPAPTASASTGTGTGTAFTNANGIGLFDAKSSPSGIETAASWLGSSSSIKYAQDFIDATDWSHISSPWQLPNWKGSPFTMMWGVPMVPCGAPATQCATNVAEFNQVASGGADSYYKTLAQNLVASGFGSSYIRLGWEFNGNWMGWSICNSQGSGLTSWASDFVPAFRNIVTSMRGVSGANFKFVWNPDASSNAGCDGASLEQFYPGDSYVDEVALDVYDGVGAATSSDAVRWTDLLDGVNAGGWTAEKPAAAGGQSFAGYGLNWLAAFGKAHDKEIGLPEWGLDASGQYGGGGDDAYFMRQMTSWIKANGSGPSIFWNDSGGTLPLDIPNYTSGGTPSATAVFKAAFGS